MKVQSKKDDKDQESIPHLSQDTQWESNKITKNITNKSQALSLRVTTRQQWADVKAWQTLDINNTNDPQTNYLLGTVSKNILLEGLNRFHGTSTFGSDVDQDT